ncbi:hypothetical protein MFM001_35810 [Mycobacterium sp. MFM001]|uniref:DUF4185 domain-containing protein n=1 Tax=Mycobacterium sp. MFM001 TaxID=2049453 RepID=UPI000DA54682|nr:DUF4185 domain-containing protein [Mycobacterium sp. MFM001]GBE67119.1 hypothetical protein MFM001_35810 [Mycobacterium sp. MFM001]
MSLTLKELLEWPPEIGDLAKSTTNLAQNYTTSAEFFRQQASDPSWEGKAGDAARASALAGAAHQEEVAATLNQAAAGMKGVQAEAEALSDQIKAVLNYADEPPAVKVDTTTGEVTAPNTGYFTDEYAAQVEAKAADVRAKVAALLAEGETADADLAKAMGIAASAGEPGARLVDEWKQDPAGLGPLKPGEVRDLGPIAGTGADGAIPGIGAADLGEVVQLPDGRYVAIFGDSFAGDRMGAGTHYPSVAVPVTFDAQGKPHFGAPLTGPDGSPNVLFPPPPQAAGKNTLPAGSIRMRDGTTYMMVDGTTKLNPDGGSWLTKVTNDPSQGWQPIDKSWRAQNDAPTQISGFQAADGNVYIAADSFDRSQGVTMYRVDPSQVTNRDAWQPWTGHGWGDPHQAAVPVTQPGVTFGELSFRDVDGKAVLSGFNQATGNTEVRVANDPTSIFSGGTPSTVVAQGGNWGDPGKFPQNYGGYILPGSTLNDLRLFVSQWNTDTNVPYDVREFQVNPKH